MFTLLLAFLTARADDALRARCLDLLSAYEDPATEADWRALGAGVDAELLAIATDVRLSHTRRANAVFALGFFPSARARAFLAGLAADAAADGIFRRKAVHALANGYGEGALAELRAALASTDAQLRAAAARAVAKIGAPTAERALEARLAVESDPMVRDTLAAALAGK
jgi:HEAT repeat protein